MKSQVSRREFLAGVAALASTCAGSALATVPLERRSDRGSVTGAGRDFLKSPFKVSVFTDEITQDFAKACEIAAEEFRVPYVELRGMWKKNIVDLDRKQLEEVRTILKRHHLRVTSIAGPLYKVDWPGAPRSRYSPKREQFNAEHNFNQQAKVLTKEIELADFFETTHIRCFDFWRLDNPEPFRAAIDDVLNAAAEKAAKHGLTIVMENEHACHTRNAQEAARTLAAVKSPAFKLNWDPGNSFFAGEKPFPDGYNLLPKDRIGHVHCKDARRKGHDDYEWAAMGQGEIDFLGQFRALKEQGYTGPVVLETHWKGGGSTEESSRISMRGMLDLLRKAGALE